MYVYQITETLSVAQYYHRSTRKRSLGVSLAVFIRGLRFDDTLAAMFGGEKFVPIIGHLSLARDMKTALQEDDEGGEATSSTGQKKILSNEEKAKKDEKNQQVIAEVCDICRDMSNPRFPNTLRRKRKSEKNASLSSWKHSHANLVYSPSPLPASTTRR